MCKRSPEYVETYFCVLTLSLNLKNESLEWNWVLGALILFIVVLIVSVVLLAVFVFSLPRRSKQLAFTTISPHLGIL